MDGKVNEWMSRWAEEKNRLDKPKQYKLHYDISLFKSSNDSHLGLNLNFLGCQNLFEFCFMILCTSSPMTSQHALALAIRTTNTIMQMFSIL